MIKRLNHSSLVSPCQKYLNSFIKQKRQNTPNHSVLRWVDNLVVIGVSSMGQSQYSPSVPNNQNGPHYKSIKDLLTPVYTIDGAHISFKNLGSCNYEYVLTRATKSTIWQQWWVFTKMERRKNGLSTCRCQHAVPNTRGGLILECEPCWYRFFVTISIKTGAEEFIMAGLFLDCKPKFITLNFKYRPV